MSKARGFKVDFIGVGAPKCGTSTMADLIASHPQVWLHPNKELNYFAKHHRIHRPLSTEYEKKGIEGYKELFYQQSPEWKKKVGEFSVFYLGDEEAPKRIKRHLPHVNLIIMLREPIAKTYSLYNMNRYFFNDTRKSFEQALKETPRYVKEGSYYWQVKQYLDLFKPSQIKVVLLEEFQKEPQKILKEVYSFIGVDDQYLPITLLEKRNTAKKTKYLSIRKVTDTVPEISKALKKARLYFLVDWARKLGGEKVLHHIVNKWNTETFTPEPIKKDTKSKLYKTFRGDVHQLNKLLHEKKLISNNVEHLWGYKGAEP